MQSVANASIIIFYLSSFLAFIGGHAVNYSLILYAQDVFGSDSLSGIGFGLAFGIPLVLGWVGGALSDRVPPVRLIIFAQIMAIMAAALLLWQDQFGGDPVFRRTLYIAAAMLAGVCWSFIAPSRLAALAQVVPQARLHMMTIVFNLLIMIGFGAAPIILAFVQVHYEWSGVFIMLIVGYAIATMMLIGIPSHSNDHDGSVTMMGQIAQGLKTARQIAILWQLLVCAALIYLMLGPLQVIVPRFASLVLGIAVLDRGLLLGILALALIIGGVAAMWAASRVHHGKAIAASIMIAALSMAVIGLSKTPFEAGVFLLLAGSSGGFGVSLVIAGLQGAAPVALRGRIMSMYTIVGQVAPASSAIAAGFLTENWGPADTLIAMGLAITILSLLVLIRLSKLYQYRS